MAELHITPDQEAALHDFYAHGDLDLLCEDLQVDRPRLHAMAKQLGLATRGHHRWTAEDEDLLRREYPTTNAAALAERLGLSAHKVHAKAHLLGLKKDPEFLRELGRRHAATNAGFLAHRKQKGCTPMNKGVPMRPEVREKVKRTWFTKGRMSQNWVPVGTEVLDDDGYLKRKVSDDRDRPSRFNWKYVHRLNWEQANGPIPKGHKVVFRDGDKTNVALENLDLITNAEMQRRNSVHNLPPEAKKVVYALGTLKSMITKRTKKAHEQEERHQ